MKKKKPKSKGKITSGDLFRFFMLGIFLFLIGIYSLATGGESTPSNVFVIVGITITFVFGYVVAAELDAFEESLNKLEKQGKKHGKKK